MESVALKDLDAVLKDAPRRPPKNAVKMLKAVEVMKQCERRCCVNMKSRADSEISKLLPLTPEVDPAQVHELWAVVAENCTNICNKRMADTLRT